MGGGVGGRCTDTSMVRNCHCRQIRVAACCVCCAATACHQPRRRTHGPSLAHKTRPMTRLASSVANPPALRAVQRAAMGRRARRWRMRSIGLRQRNGAYSHVRVTHEMGEEARRHGERHRLAVAAAHAHIAKRCALLPRHAVPCCYRGMLYRVVTAACCAVLLPWHAVPCCYRVLWQPPPPCGSSSGRGSHRPASPPSRIAAASAASRASTQDGVALWPSPSATPSEMPRESPTFGDGAGGRGSDDGSTRGRSSGVRLRGSACTVHRVARCNWRQQVTPG